ncbi:MAG: uracil-DNA glycosylase [Candidatus Aquirickettsiella gammari]|uniref:Type-4 uracil-DNA glycosylase n=1 Tax=Candidatus Aquirickettsiella gammari TaxID=2016198 RepID=A0A370CIZ9_9COXI|nr:MAG: uracil-DNA glycosylase [Candidatus Aquirickettsiella gammari]
MLVTEKRLAYFKAMDIQIWVSRGKTDKLTEQDIKDDAVPIKLIKTREQEIAALNWKELRLAVSTCKACNLYKTRSNSVFGIGNPNADLLVIGEAPGANEDKQGEPFVGRGGQLLTNMLLSIGFKREDVYIANILKSRPPNNRDPSFDEVKACTPYLLRQISLIKPRLILAVGRIAAHYLLSTNATMASLRGNLFHYGADKIPLLVTYHPAYLLRSPREKRKAWQDMQCVKKQLNREMIDLLN